MSAKFWAYAQDDRGAASRHEMLSNRKSSCVAFAIFLQSRLHGAPLFMKGTAMGWNHRMNDDGGKADFLREILAYGMITEKAKGILTQAIHQGEGSLSSKQQYISETQIMERFTRKDCVPCFLPLQWPEMFEAHLNGGHCSRCVHNLCGDLADIGRSWEDLYGDDTAIFLIDLYALHQQSKPDQRRQEAKKSQIGFLAKKKRWENAKGDGDMFGYFSVSSKPL